MNGTYRMTPEQRVEWEAEVRSLYDGMVRIVVSLAAEWGRPGRQRAPGTRWWRRHALGPGPLPTLGVDGLGRADLAEQLLRAVLVQQGQQLLPGSQLEQVDQPARAVAQQDSATEASAREGAGDGLARGPWDRRQRPSTRRAGCVLAAAPG
jgi:hypothetical protein